MPVLTGESDSSVFRRSDNSVYAKCSTARGVTELDEERQRIDWLASNNMPGPDVLSWAQSDLGGCLITSAVPGIPASDLPSPDLREAWSSIVRTIRSLHDLRAVACPLDSRLATLLNRAEDVIQRRAVNPEFLLPEQRQTEPAELLRGLRAEAPDRIRQEAENPRRLPRRRLPPNIMVDPDTKECAGLIDLGRLGLAERYVDLSLLVANSQPNWQTDDEARQAFDQLFNLYGIETPNHELLRFYLHLDPLTWG